jgi:CheY-like chemotaxis protein
MGSIERKLNLVLLIDNNEIDNFIHRKILERCGASNILTFESTITALEYLTLTTDIPQLILLDINFPEMNGFEFLDEFRKLEISQHTLDIFILSVSSNPADIKKAQQKCSGFIEKLLTKEKLFTQMDRLPYLERTQQ